jgi:hypothetical protein
MMQPDSLKAALATEAINTALSSIVNQSAVERGEVVDNRMSMGTMCDTSDTLDIDFLIAVQSGCLTTDHITSLDTEASAIIKEHQAMAVDLVQMKVKLVDGSLPDTDIIALMGSSNASSFDNGDNVMIFYDVKASGEDLHWPEMYTAQLRKTHLDRSIKLARYSRTPGELHILDSDVFVLMDGGCSDGFETLVGSMQCGADQALLPVPYSNRTHPLHAIHVDGHARMHTPHRPIHPDDETT